MYKRLLPAVALLLFVVPDAASAGVPTTSVAGYSVETTVGRNNRSDASYLACDLTLGCFDNTGARCSLNPNERCDVQVVPAGRCTAGTGSCIWPSGAGVCVGGDPVPCLTNAYLDYLDAPFGAPPTGSGVSSMCANAGGTGDCDMTTNNPSCDCTGTDPLADPGNTDPNVPSWEGGVCGSGVDSVCSDGDRGRSIRGFGRAECYQYCTDSVSCQPDPTCGAIHTLEGSGVVGSKLPTSENPLDDVTLQRPPSADGLPLSPIVTTYTTQAIEVDSAGLGDFSAFGMRGGVGWSNSFHADPAFTSTAQYGPFHFLGPRANACEIPLGAGWSPGQPVSASCLADPNFFCISDTDCFGLEPPLCDAASARYCHDNDSDRGTIDAPGLDATGFGYTRVLETAEQSGNCPPDCRRAWDVDTMEDEVVRSGAFSGDPRVGTQIFYDNLEGQRVRKGDVLAVAPLVLTTWVQAGDGRCFIGGDPNRPDPADAKIGRCDLTGDPCDPTLAPGTGDCLSNGSCSYCEGTIDGSAPPDSTNSSWTLGGNDGFNPVRGNPQAQPVGYQTHGVGALDLGGRLGILNSLPSTHELPIVLLLTHGPTAATFADNSCSAATTDKCDLGQVNGGSSGIGASTLIISQGDPVPHHPSGPGYQVDFTVPPSDPGAPPPGSSAARTFDWGPGPDGVPGCMGDNARAGPGTPCDERLGDPGSPGSTGLDDTTISYDYSALGDGSVLRTSVQARHGSVSEVLVRTPVWTSAATLSFRDAPAIGNTDGLDAIVKSEFTLCPIVSRNPETGEIKTACLDSDLDGDGLLDEQDGCPLNPAIGLIDENTNPDTGGVENPNSDPGGFLPDGIADACQCGDVNDDGRVTGNDSTFIKRACLGLAPFENTVVGETGCAQSQPGPPANVQPFNRDKCDVGSGGGGPGACSGNDSTVVRRTTLGLVLPGIKNTCTAYGQPPAP